MKISLKEEFIMNCSRCNGSSNCGSCREGERIIVNQSGCGCNQTRRRCACENTYRPGSGCGNSCGCNRPCPPRPCPPRPCPKPCRPNWEDRCRAQYRQCMRDGRCHEAEREREKACGCGCGNNNCGCNRNNGLLYEENENWNRSCGEEEFYGRASSCEECDEK